MTETTFGSQVHPRVRDQLQARLDEGEYDAVLAQWKAYSLAEDARDLNGLVATLTEDCVYELVGGDVEPGHRWEGHDGARAFYTAFTVVIVFPWDPATGRFRGERVIAVRDRAVDA